MKIAILAPSYLPVPPPLYGGTERIVSLLTEGLVARGHDVTLFASGDSKTSATLAGIYPVALGNSGLAKSELGQKVQAHYRACYDRAGEFDIIHSHGQYDSFAGAAGLKTPVVFTMHGSYYQEETTPQKRELLAKHKHLRFISISKNQRGGMPDLTYVGNVYNALDISGYDWHSVVDSDYLLWVGRTAAKKGALDAILAAKNAGIRLEMAAAIDPLDRPYFDEVIKPHIDGVSVVYHGEVGPDALVELYGGALATLFPITWHEPFGLIMIESMACGTPVIAYANGSVPEVIKDGVTGFIVGDGRKPTSQNPMPNSALDWKVKQAGVNGLVEAIGRIGGIDRAACRRRVEQYFTAGRMVDEYINVYDKVLNESVRYGRSR